jgi:TatD DNase family protein
MDLVDTHCHIHSTDYPLDKDEVIKEAVAYNVTKMICVGTDLEDSKVATEFVIGKPYVWASIGIHPHESKRYVNDQYALSKFEELVTKDKVVAIGECGLDYFYDHSGKDDQKKLLEFQLNIAKKYDLPLIFHVRDAFEDFWPIFDNFKDLRGVIHSFTSDTEVLNQAIERGLYIGLNGIMTFTKNAVQLNAAKRVPKDKLVLETDAPFLTPTPYRGTICQPKHVRNTAEFLAKLRQESLEELSTFSTKNAVELFNLSIKIS